MTRIPTLATILLAAALAPAAWAQSFQEGEHYERISGPDVSDADGIIEVVEVFSYMCPHCANFQPHVEPWHSELPDDVEFSRVPVSFNRSWEPFARAYYTADVLDILDESHDRLFEALHGEGRNIRSISDLAEFHSEFGVSPESFTSTARSFPVESRMRMGNASIGKWRVRSTPTLIINGKYRVSPRRGGTFEEMLEVADHLIERERAAVQTASAESS